MCKNSKLDISAKYALALEDRPEPVKVIGNTHIELFDEVMQVVSNLPGLDTVSSPCGKITHGKSPPPSHLAVSLSLPISMEKCFYLNLLETSRMALQKI